MAASKKRYFDFSYLPVIFTLAWPTMLEEILSTAVQYIDTAMVGSLGTKATAAVGSTSTVNWLVYSTVYALGVGFLAYISQAMGRGDSDRVKKAVMQAMITAAVMGTVFTVLVLSVSKAVPVWMNVDEEIRDLAARYFFVLYLPMLPRTANMILGTVLRASGDTKTPMRVGLSMNAINLALNMILIKPTRVVSFLGKEFTVFGAGMGVIGAATASAVSYLYGGIAIVISIFRHEEISPKGLPVRIEWEIMGPCLKTAIPNMFQRFGSSLGYVVFASMINSLGGISTAAHTIANTVESAFYIPGFGMMAAAATLTGNAIGAGDKEKLHSISRMTILCEVVMMVFTGSLLFIFAPKMVGIFSKDAEVIALCSTVLRMVACSEPFFGVSNVLEGMLQGAGDTKFSFAVNIIAIWTVRILGTFICTRLLGLGLEAAWACMIAHNMTTFLCYTVYYRRGKWAHPIPEAA
ncbi:MAG: MATE family efflux transporter [Oscillospiraceae bacterium]|nr:MATE family efflux transporter [Oscillospiraceae bacterium]MBR6389815.1 MATE family efflux transporter [Lachnospiraceae bacterium]